MRIRLWRGFHDPTLGALIERAWFSAGTAQSELLILCPPLLEDFSFIDQLPPGEIEWSEGLQPPARKDHSDAFSELPCLGVFTSGTAGGKPRLVLYTRKNILTSLDAVRGCFDAARIKALFCYPQPFHTFGLCLGYIHALVHRLPLITGEGPYNSGFHALRANMTEPGLLTLGAPAHFHDLIAWTKAAGAKLAPSYSCILGGARVSASLWRQTRDTLAIEAPSIGYGCTEASPGITHLPAGHEPLEDGEIGFVLGGMRLQIISGEGAEFSGGNLCLAIIQDGKLEFPTSVLIRDRLQARPSDGALVHQGRTDLVLNRGGAKYSLELFEEALLRETGLSAVCVPLPDERLGEELGVLLQGVRLLEPVQRLLRERFGIAILAANVASTERLPLNASLKFDRPSSARLILAEKGLSRA